MNPSQVKAVISTVDDSNVDDLPVIDGWRASWEYPGFVTFNHGDLPDRYVCATPDWGGVGIIGIEVTTINGHTLDAFEAPWPAAGRTLESYVAIMRPILGRVITAAKGPQC